MATLVRWEPIRELATLQTEMSRLMNGLFEGNGRAAQEWVPAVDVWEQEDELVYAFDLPGVPEDRSRSSSTTTRSRSLRSGSAPPRTPRTASAASSVASAASRARSACRQA